MNIGIDLTPLQTGHRLRGIGSTIINIINNISTSDRKNHYFIFYILPIDECGIDPFESIETSDFRFEIRYIGPKKRSQRKLPRRLQIIIRAYNSLLEVKDLYFGDSRINNLNNLDVFLQTDQSQSLPRRRKLKTALIVYDIIPYVIEWDYLWSYKTARLKGYSRKSALRVHLSRFFYAFKLRINANRADKVLSISKSTKNDFVNKLSVNSDKIVVTPLGINQPSDYKKTPSFEYYVKTSWGYSKRNLSVIKEKSYILFVGGADHRRRLQDLVTSFNHLRAEGHEIKLILAGDSMQGPLNISTLDIQSALINSSYLDDIIFMGFVNNDVRDWLYRNALVFVFPSRYEGFGLPVLEAMSYGCPVIAYKNLATVEVANNIPLYADNSYDITKKVTEILNYDSHEREKIESRSMEQSKNYSWGKTSKRILSELDF